jgi:hypothetical protein
MGIANSTEDVVYFSGGPLQPVQKTGSERLTVTLTGFKPGNAILVFYTLAPQDSGTGASGINFVIHPVIDLGGGGGFQMLSQTDIVIATGPNPSFATQVTAVVPVTGDVATDPVVGLDIQSSGPDPIDVPAQNVMLVACELDASALTSLPTTTLV